MRIFDSIPRTTSTKAGIAQKTANAAAAERAGELEQLDNIDAMFRDKLGAERSISAIRYESVRKPGSKWMLEHAANGVDYMFQCFPLKPPRYDINGVIGRMIVALDAVFPRSYQITYMPPNDKYEIKFYTIKVADIVGKPGWERAKSRAIDALIDVDAWS